ncbi:hypothetical protein QTP86_008646 [Hemibagrus guttatus]|nr:hypothetical protein QTP86_008646 [Hemibagrus guttatus]
MAADVRRYVQGCEECAMVKTPRQLPSGKLLPLPVPNRPWSHLGVDFITDLPNSRTHTCIFVIVDRFSKACRLLPLKGPPTAMEAAELLFNQVFRYFGIPEDIVSDWGPQFVSRVWRAFFTCLCVAVNLSSGYHPQTNGQTERKIQEISRYLRTFCYGHQDLWSQCLGWTEYAQNSLRQPSTGLTPFQCVLGYQPPLFPWSGEPSDVRTVDHWFRESERVWGSAHHQLQHALRRRRLTADRRRSDAPAYRPGQKVWLSTKDIRLRLPSRKDVTKRKKKAFSDGEVVKEAMMIIANTVLKDEKNGTDLISTLSDVQLGASTMARRVSAMSGNLADQLDRDLAKCRWFSIQCDESVDSSSTAQLLVFIRMVFEDFSTREELLTLLPLKTTTRGVDIYNTVKEFFVQKKVPLEKLVAVTTDGDPAMIGRQTGFIAHCKADPDFPKFLHYHCIIHQQALCAKVIGFGHVMTPVVKIINNIRSKAKQHRIFKVLLEEMSAEYGDLLLHTEIRWLSRGRVLHRFLSLLGEIKEFMQSKGEDVSLLKDTEWTLDLAFLTDITGRLNHLNCELQGKEEQTKTEEVYQTLQPPPKESARNAPDYHFRQSGSEVLNNQTTNQGLDAITDPWKAHASANK